MRLFFRSSSKSGSKSSRHSTTSSRSKDKSKRSKPTASPQNELNKPAEDPPQPTLKADPVEEITTETTHLLKEPARKRTEERIRIADNKLNGMHIAQYIDAQMNSSLSNADGSVKNEKEERERLAQVLDQFNPPGLPESADLPEAMQRLQSSKEVQKTVETLDPSYSVKKTQKNMQKNLEHLEKSSDNLLQLPAVVDDAKVTAFLHARPTTFATEGTPVELSRCTSLSNITMDSEKYEFTEMKRKMLERKIPTTTAASNASENATPLTSSSATEKRTKNDTGLMLDNIQKQISKMTISSTMSEGSHTLRTGYVTSLPQSDEIKKFCTEGSISCTTNLSALTTDSGNKVAPCIPDSGGVDALLTPGNNCHQATTAHPVTSSLSGHVEPVFKEEDNSNSTQHYGPDTKQPINDKTFKFGVSG